MKKLINILLLFLVSISFQLLASDSKFIQSDQIEDLLPEITPDTLLLFDVDDTLIIGPRMVGSHEWFDELMESIAKYPVHQQERYASVTIQVLQNLTPHVTDSVLPQLIRQLQEQKIRAYAFTARGKNGWYHGVVPGIDAATVAQLAKVGISFGATLEQAPFDQHPGFGKGIFYSDGDPKGPFLVQVLKSVQFTPDKVVVVDDKKQQVDSVMQALEKEGIPVVGFHYTKISGKKSPYNQKGARLQMKLVRQEGIYYSEEQILEKLKMMQEEQEAVSTAQSSL